MAAVVIASAALTGCVSNTPFKEVVIRPNETVSIPYTITCAYNPFTDITKYPASYGYMIVSIPDPGTYSLIATTNNPDDKIGIEWAETFEQTSLEGDKFEKHPVTRTMTHFVWGGGRVTQCISDRTTDCNLNMGLAKYERNPTIQIYISGHGSGDIIITKMENDL
jgi:hypothetical protein